MISFIKNKISSENKKYFAVIAIFALINIILLTTAIHKFVSPFISDSYEYQETAKYLVSMEERKFFLIACLNHLRHYCSDWGRFLLI